MTKDVSAHARSARMRPAPDRGGRRREASGSGARAAHVAAFRMPPTHPESRPLHVRVCALRLAIIALIASVAIAPRLGAQSASPAAATNPRFGRWKLKSDAPAPASNIMTYSAYGASGMKVQIESGNTSGDTTRWGYVTEFDGRDMPVTGNPGQTHASVRRVSDAVNEIINSKDGVVTQRLTSVLSPDHNTIAVIYMRDDGQGKTTRVTFATYERMP